MLAITRRHILLSPELCPCRRVLPHFEQVEGTTILNMWCLGTSTPGTRGGNESNPLLRAILALGVSIAARGCSSRAPIPDVLKAKSSALEALQDAMCRNNALGSVWLRPFGTFPSPPKRGRLYSFSIRTASQFQTPFDRRLPRTHLYPYTHMGLPRRGYPWVFYALLLYCQHVQPTSEHRFYHG